MAKSGIGAKSDQGRVAERRHIGDVIAEGRYDDMAYAMQDRVTCREHKVVEHFGGRWWCDSCGEVDGERVAAGRHPGTYEEGR